MAKKSYVIVKLESTLGTGYFLAKRRNAKNQKKLSLKKFDPVARKHALFVEKKIK